MERAEGFIEVKIKTMSEANVLALDKEYEKWEALNIDPSTYINEDDYAELTSVFVRPEEIKAYKRADDGNVDISLDSFLNFSRVYVKMEDFLELLKSTK